MAVDTSKSAKIVVVTGSSGSGKSLWVKKQVRRARRLIVWDIDDEYSQSISAIVRFTSIKALVSAVKKAKTGKFAFVGKVSDFEMFCRVAFAWANCTCVVEELADVTMPAKAPEGWGQLVRRGRKYGIEIYAITQRPSESDKTIIGNASIIHAGRMNRAQDRAYMAKEMDMRLEVINDLKPLEFVEKYDNGETKRGKVRF